MKHLAAPLVVIGLVSTISAGCGPGPSSAPRSSAATATSATVTLRRSRLRDQGTLTETAQIRAVVSGPRIDAVTLFAPSGERLDLVQVADSFVLDVQGDAHAVLTRFGPGPYTFSVAAADEVGSLVIAMEGELPALPRITEPADMSAGVSTTPTLRWTTGAAGARFDVSIARVVDDRLVLRLTTVGASSVSVPSGVLDRATRYRLEVRSCDGPSVLVRAEAGATIIFDTGS